MVIVAPSYAGPNLNAVRGPALDAVAAVVARAGLFQTVDPAVAAKLTTQLAAVNFARRQQIYAEGDPGDQLYIVTSGKVKIGRHCPDGRSHLLAIAGPSDTLGELSLFDPGPRTATATALTDVGAVALDRSNFRAWVAEHPQIAERLLQVLARRLRRTDSDLSDLIFTDVAARVAKHLLRLAQRFGVPENGALRVTHNLTQEELAQLIGTSRETVNKVLGDFTGHGWIRLDRESVLINESESLVRRAHRTGAPDTNESPAAAWCTAPSPMVAADPAPMGISPLRGGQDTPRSAKSDRTY